MRQAIEINLDVLALNKGTLENSLFRRWNLDFSSFSKYKYLLPNAFDGGNVVDENDIGIYLHMTLPRDLRTSSETGEFPLIPNRWLIVRVVDNQTKSVVLESDCPDDDGTPFLLTPTIKDIFEKSKDPIRNNFEATPLQGGLDLQSINLGKVFDFKDWQERAANDVFLTASENGDIMFSAYCSHNRNILSYVDTMDDIDPNKKTTVDYYVIGWLSSNDATPLYFASSSGIAWHKNGVEDKENDPYFATYDIAPINIVLGNNANDAFLSLFAQQLAGHDGKVDKDEILSLFSALLNDYTADMDKADDYLHTSFFSILDAAPSFYSEKNKDISNIIILCEQIENKRKNIVALRENLWLDFWRFSFLNFIHFPQKNYTGKESKDYANINTQKLIDEIISFNKDCQMLDTLIKNNPDIKNKNIKRYYKPLPPSLIVSGLNAPKDVDPTFDGKRTIDVSTEREGNLPAGVSATLKLMQEEPSANPHKQPYDPIYIEWNAKYIHIPFEYWEFDGFNYRLKEDVNVGSFDGILIGSISPLSRHFETVVKDKFSILGEKLGQKIDTNSLDIKILSQDLTGFIEAIAQRDIRPFGTPNDIIGNVLGFDNDADLLSLDWFPKLCNDAPNGTPYFDLRSGVFTLTDLAIYDKFGRKIIFINSTQETGVVYADNYPLIISNPIKNKYALLPPAFLMQTTLLADMELQFFVTHNVVNESFILHSKNKEFLGEIMVINSNIEYKGSINNPKISNFIDDIIKGGMKRFTEIAALIDDTLSKVQKKPDNVLSAALGRPLAMINVNLRFDFNSNPYRNINWADNGNDPTYWSYDFPFTVGDPMERNDGLITTFDNVGRLGVHKPANFTALCVPDTYVTVRTGLLPPFKFHLPNEASNCADIEQRINVNGAKAFITEGDKPEIYMPVFKNQNVHFVTADGKTFSIASNLKPSAVPVLASGILLDLLQK